MKLNRHTNFVVVLGISALCLSLPAHSIGATAPVVATVTASNVAATTAILKGSANPGGTSTIAWLEWGSGYAIKQSTTPTNLGTGAASLPFTAPVTGLTAGVIYHCRAVASNSLGIVRGQTLPFGVPAVTLNGTSPLTNDLNSPFIDPGATAVANPVTLAVGDSFTLALKADGNVVGWGDNSSGQTSITNTATNTLAIAAGYVHALALRNNGTVLGWGQNDYDQISIPPEATNVIALAAGYSHSMGLRRDGTVVTWGSDDYGQVTVPPEATNVIAIAAGSLHSLALRANGTVVAWGWDDFGQVTLPPAATNAVAIAAGSVHSLALRANGTIVAWGGEAPAVVAVPASATNVVAIAAGYAHTLALRANGTIVSWGLNIYGETNVPPAATNVIAIGAGFGFSQALRADGVVIGWGLSSSNRTTTPTNLITQLPVVTAGIVNTAVPGTYPLLYSATNVFGFAGTSTRSVMIVGSAPVISTRTLLGNGSFQLGLDFTPGASVTVLATTNISLPSSNWTVLGAATEDPAGHYQFTDSTATSYPRRFYQVRTP